VNGNSTLRVKVEGGGTQVVAHVGLHALGQSSSRPVSANDTCAASFPCTKTSSGVERSGSMRAKGVNDRRPLAHGHVHQRGFGIRIVPYKVRTTRSRWSLRADRRPQSSQRAACASADAQCSVTTCSCTPARIAFDSEPWRPGDGRSKNS
jgi:hypothetical protein